MAALADVVLVADDDVGARLEGRGQHVPEQNARQDIRRVGGDVVMEHHGEDDGHDQRQAQGAQKGPDHAQLGPAELVPQVQLDQVPYEVSQFVDL